MSPLSQAVTWIAAILITGGVGAIAAQESAPPEGAAQIEPRAVPKGVCPPRHVGVWIESGVMECLKELP